MVLIVFPSFFEGVGNGLEDVPIDSDYSSSFVTVKSLTLSKFDSCQSKVSSFRGNLAKCYKEWEKIGASGFILSVIRNGYKIPLCPLLRRYGLCLQCALLRPSSVCWEEN